MFNSHNVCSVVCGDGCDGNVYVYSTVHISVLKMKDKDGMNMCKKIKSKYANWIYSHTSFPDGCKSGNELDWMLKNNCPECLSHPIESLSNAEYHKKYPARNRLALGTVTIYLCDVHLKKLYEDMQKYYENS